MDNTNTIKKSRLSVKQRAVMIVIGAFLCMTVTKGIINGMLSMFIAPLILKLDSDAASIGLLYTFSSVASLLSVFVAPLIVRKFKSNIVIVVGGVLGMIGLILIANATSLVMVYIGAFVAGAASFLSSNACLQPIINRWFLSGTNTVTGITQLSEFFGTTVFAFISAGFIAAGKWETAGVICGICLGVIVVLAGLFLLKGYPENYGMKPIGWDKVYAADTDKKSASKDELQGMTAKQALRSPKFWLLWFASVVLICGSLMYANQQATIYIQKGMDSVQVAALLSAWACAKSINAVVYGVISDKFGLRIGLTYISVLAIVGLILMNITSGYGPLLIAAILVGSAQGTAGFYATNACRKLIGQKSIAELGMVPHSGAAVGAIIAPILFAVFFNASGGDATIGTRVGIIFWVVFLIISILQFAPKYMVEKDGWALRKERKAAKNGAQANINN